MQQNFTDPKPRTDETSDRSVSIHPRTLLKGALTGAAAYVLCSPLIFSVNPLPLALVCAADRQVGWVLTGILLGAWQQGGSVWWTLAAAALAITIRLLRRLFTAGDAASVLTRIRQHLRRYADSTLLRSKGEDARDELGPKVFPLTDTVSQRALIALFCALVPSLGICISGGFVFYDLYGSIVYMLLTPPLTALFSHLALFVSKNTPLGKGAASGGIRLAARVLLVACLCFCGRPVRLFGLSLAVLFAVWICLDNTYRSGLPAGVLWSLVCGLPYDIFIVPLLIGTCAVYAVLQKIIGSFSLLVAALGGSVYLLLFAKDEVLWGVLPALIIGVCLFSAKQRLYEHASPSAVQATKSTEPADDDAHLARMIIAQTDHAQTLRAISSISGAFSSLAEIFRESQALCELPFDETYELCQEAFDLHCSLCPQKTACQRKGKEPYRCAIRAVGKHLRTHGELGEVQAQAFPFRDCPHHAQLARHINDRYAKACYDMLQYDARATFAMNCDGIAHLFRDVLHREREQSERMHPALSEAVAGYLKDLKLPVHQAVVYGKDRLTVRIPGLSPAALTVPQEQFREGIGRLLGAKMSKLHTESGEEGGISLYTLPAWEVRCRYRSEPAAAADGKGRPPCGDTVRTFESADGTFYALLCDGMGHGHRAAVTSGLCAVFLERTLRAGVSVATALSLLNQYLLARAKMPEQEISSTVDLFCFDRYTGRGELIKSGAAPSRLLRGGRQFCLSAHTLPIGILHTIDAHVLPLEGQAGDQLIMMSDGVCEGETSGTGEDWLSELLSHEHPEDHSELIRTILKEAQSRNGADDMSVISICIEAQETADKENETA